MEHTIPIAVLLRKRFKRCKFQLPVFAASLISKLMVMPDSMKVFYIPLLWFSETSTDETDSISLALYHDCFCQLSYPYFNEILK